MSGPFYCRCSHIEYLGEFDGGPDLEFFVGRHPSNRVELKKHLGREDIGFTIEQVGGVGLKRLLTILEDPIFDALAKARKADE